MTTISGLLCGDERKGDAVEVICGDAVIFHKGFRNFIFLDHATFRVGLLTAIQRSGARPDKLGIRFLETSNNRQASAVIECPTFDADHAVGNVDARQASAAIECVIPNASDAVGNGDVRQASAAPECARPDAGDGKLFNHAYDYKCASLGCRIIGNRHRYVVGIDLVCIQARYCSPRVA